MGVRGFYSAQDGHLVSIIPPKDITGGAVGAAFAMKNYAHASIFLQIGVSAAAPTAIIVNAVTNAAGANPVAIPYQMYTAETSAGTANSDVTSLRTAVNAVGYTPSANDNIMYVIELEASQLPAGFAYVQLQVTNGTNSVIASAMALLSGARFGGDQMPSVLT